MKSSSEYFRRAWSLSVVVFGFLFLQSYTTGAQVTYGASASYGLRELNPAYTGSCIQIRRSCDNALKNISFNACGGLDTTAIRAFILVANPLTAISTASSAAFGLRKLNCSYSGSAIQVRRSSDNALLNIGFTSDGDLDTAAMKTFIGTNSAFVTTWYDQSGNGRNATQATTTRQPRIMNAGLIDRQNTKPAIYFQGITFGLFTGNLNIFGTNASFNSVAKVRANLTYNATVNTTNGNLPSPLDFYNNQVVIGNGVSYTFYTPSQTFDAAKPLGIWTYSGTSGGAVNMWYNSASILASTAGFFGSSNTPMAIGSRNDAVTGLDGWISEVITFAAIPSATDRLFVEWTQSQYYNISGVSLGTIPPGASSAYVTAWYDQSGNGKTLVQTSTANQPRIMNVGVSSSTGGFPAIPLDGTNYYLSESTLSVSNPYSANVVAVRSASSAGYQRLLNISATADGYGFLGASGGDYATFTGNGGAWNDVNANTALTPVTLNARSILSMTAAAGATGLLPYINGTTQTAKVGTTATATGFLLGAPYSGTNLAQLWTGSVTECNIFPSAVSTTQRRLFESNQSAYYNTTISNNKYTPPAALSYNLFVNGVGRESATDSVAGTRITLGMGVKVGQTGTDFLKDAGDYITFGTSCPITYNGVSTTFITGTTVQRWTTEWYLNKTDAGTNNGTLNIYFDFSEYGALGTPGTASNYVLLTRTGAAANFTTVAGTTVSVSGDRINFSVDASNITTNRYYTVGTRNITTSPLPVELISFEGSTCSSSVCLHWETATELNNDYFLVERSNDALNFSEIGKVDSKADNGNSNIVLSYGYKDKEPLSGTSYYRLNQFDINGDSKNSNIISVQFDPARNISFVVYPNPNSGEFSVDFSGLENNHEIRVSMMDIQGKTIYNNIVDLQALGTNAFKIIPEKRIDNGVYLVMFEIQGIKYMSKVIVE
jgi:hypothetical protein